MAGTICNFQYRLQWQHHHLNQFPVDTAVDARSPTACYRSGSPILGTFDKASTRMLFRRQRPHHPGCRQPTGGTGAVTLSSTRTAIQTGHTWTSWNFRERAGAGPTWIVTASWHVGSEERRSSVAWVPVEPDGPFIHPTPRRWRGGALFAWMQHSGGKADPAIRRG